MISVIIPLYNKTDYISKAVESVLGQSFKKFELIIVNDGSTDDSLRKVEKYNDLRIRIIDQPNTGVSIARNNGVKAASYDFIAFLDADDWWAPGYLEEMMELVMKYPEAGIWSAKYYYVKHGRNKEANIGLDNGFTDGYINYYKVYARTMWMPVYPPSVVLPKKVFNEFGGFKPELKLGEDFHLWVRIALNYKVAYLNKPLVYYNQDVDANLRAVGGLKIWKPKEHYIFNLGDLSEEESSNTDLKNLLDKMRLRAMLRYHLAGQYRQEKKQVLTRVDFTKHAFVWRLRYNSPPFLLRSWRYVKRIGSNCKSRILRLT